MTAYSLGGGWPISRWIELFERTRDWLRTHITGERHDDRDLNYITSSTLSQIDAMRDGCRWLVRVDRTGQWRACLRPADMISVSREPGYTPSRLHTVTGSELAPWRQAAAIFGTIPAVPQDAVTFPGAIRTYASIPVPGGAAEALERLEEIESTIWGLATPRREVRTLDPEPLRRTYAFFDVGLWLVRSIFGKGIGG